MALLRISQGGTFTCNTLWLFYVWYKLVVLLITQDSTFYESFGVAVLQLTEVGSFRVTKGGSFAYGTGWLFYE